MDWVQMESLLYARKNIFEHIFYEMDMFYETRFYLLTHKYKSSLEHNMAVESHSVHLRNLIEFFGTSSKYITSATILLNVEGLSLNTKVELAGGINAFAIPSQITSHLTHYRCNNDAYQKSNAVVNAMFPRISENIMKFIELIAIPDNVCQKYSDQLNENQVDIQIVKIKSLHNWFIQCGAL